MGAKRRSFKSAQIQNSFSAHTSLVKVSAELTVRFAPHFAGGWENTFLKRNNRANSWKTLHDFLELFFEFRTFWTLPRWPWGKIQLCVHFSQNFPIMLNIRPYNKEPRRLSIGWSKKSEDVLCSLRSATQSRLPSIYLFGFGASLPPRNTWMDCEWWLVTPN